MTTTDPAVDPAAGLDLTPEPRRLTFKEVRDVARDVDALAAAIDLPFPQWAKNCHGISLRLLRTGLFGPGRIARGHTRGVIAQHSWIVLDDDCYEPGALIVDPTLWSYDDRQTGILVARGGDRPHIPHGAGLIWQWGRPDTPTEEPIRLTPATPLSAGAEDFLMAMGPLDLRGWMALANVAPVEGWPAGEIYAAMKDTPALSPLVPIDRIGMLTDRNPGGLYR